MKRQAGDPETQAVQNPGRQNPGMQVTQKGQKRKATVER